MDDFRQIGERLRNWGRWGDDDERGTLNLITPEAMVAAAGLVREGRIFELGIPFDSDGPQMGGVRMNPVHMMTATGDDQNFGDFHYADDYIFMPLQCATQWDGLAHVYYDDKLYNGFPASDVTPNGAKHCSIDKIAKGVFGRGVLLDIARLKGVDWLEAGTVITPDDLDEAAELQGVAIQSGDILLFRTGWRSMFTTNRDPKSWFAGEPGLGLECCDWIGRHEIAAVGSDNWGIEVVPSEIDEQMPLHMVMIRDMGLTLGEIFDLEELAEDCARDGVYEFAFAAPPLRITGAVGSPINPLAIK